MAHTLRQRTAGIDVNARKSESTRKIHKRGFEKVNYQLDDMIELAPERRMRFDDEG